MSSAAGGTKVTVILVTYNHEGFVRQALDSVLMQQTAFPFDIVVLEDCSTDGTRDVLVAYQRQYPEQIRLVLAESNRCDNRAIMRAIAESRSPFVTLLDGDDYWTSPQKLQQQVEYLERRGDCALAFHNALMSYEDGSREPRRALPAEQPESSTLSDLLRGCFVPTCTVMLRRSALEEIPDWYADDPCGDWSLFLLAARHGNLGYQPDVMAVYRQHPGGFWVGQGRQQQLERVIEFYRHLLHRMPAHYASQIRALLASQCYQLALEHQRLGRFEASQERLRECLAAEPDLRRVLASLRVAAGSAAELVFPASQPDTIRVAISKAAATKFDIQLNFPHVPVQANRRYSIEFRGRADQPRPLALGFAEAHEPWAGLGLHKSIALTREWQRFVEPFVATGDDLNGRIHFDAGDSPVPFEVAGVGLRSVPDGTMIGPGIPVRGAS